MNLPHNKSVYCYLIRAIAQEKAAVATFFSFLAAEHDGFCYSPGWALVTGGNSCHNCIQSGALLFIILVTTSLGIERIAVFEHFGGLGMDDLLDYFAFEYTGEFARCAGDWIDRSTYVYEVASDYAVRVFHPKFNECNTNGARLVVEE